MKTKGNASEYRDQRRVQGLLVIATGAAVLGTFVLPLLDSLTQTEARAQNELIASASNRVQTESVVFLEIDEQSLTLDALWPEDIESSPALSQMAKSGWSWPRDVFALAIDKLIDAGASVVVIDLIFDTEREGDETLRNTLDSHRNQVVIASNFYDASQPDKPIIPSITMPASSLITDPATDSRVGYANFWPEMGYIRSIVWQTPLWARAQQSAVVGATEYRSLAAATLIALGRNDLIPTGHEPVAFLFPNPDTILRIPFYSIFLDTDWNIPLRGGEVFKDKIVVIGSSAIRLQDFHTTPVDARLPGPLVHTSAIAAALSGTFYTNLGWIGNACAMVLVAGVSFFIVSRIRRPTMILAGMLLAAGGWILFVSVLFGSLLILLPLVKPVLVIFAIGVTSLAWTFTLHRTEAVRLRSTLDRYVSRNVVREILDNRDDFLTTLGGTRLPVTVLFSDVRGFTSYAERADAASVVMQLNEYFAAMVEIVFRHGGTVDKFLGDGLMAVWGNVLSNGAVEDTVHAVKAATEMQERLILLNQSWIERSLPPFRVGIGLHHGDAIFGNIGSEEKMEPTVIGDPVNLASRVEGITKQYKQQICLTESVACLVRSQIPLRSVDLVIVAGKSQPIDIFTVVLSESGMSHTSLTNYADGIRLFRERQFRDAAIKLQACLDGSPDDYLANLHFHRANDLVANPPADDWTPAVQLKQK
jgi:adenylate cyclase